MTILNMCLFLEKAGQLGPRVNSAAGLDGDEEVVSEEEEVVQEEAIVGRLKLKGGSSKKRRREEEPVAENEDRVADGHDLDIEATNALRAKLGLKPLRT